MDITLAFSFKHVCLQSRFISTAVKTDRNAHFDQLAAQAQDAKSRNDARSLFAIAKSIQGRPPAKPTMIKLEDGSFATTYNQSRQSWLRFHAKKLAAEVVAPGDALARNINDQRKLLKELRALVGACM